VPILFIHGVNTRSRRTFLALKPYLERHVAPAISPHPATVLIDDLYWGDLAAKFAWDGDSRPRSRLLGQGATDANTTSAFDLLTTSTDAGLLSKLPTTVKPTTAGSLISGSAAVTPPPAARLKDLPADQLSNYLALLLQTAGLDDAQRAELTLRADDLAYDLAFRAELASAPGSAQEKEILLRHLQPPAPKLVGMGGKPAWLTNLQERLDESLRRAADLPAFTLATVAGELRRPLNDFISVFLGDVLVYLRTRGTPADPGPIPTLLIAKLRDLSANAASRSEPLVLFSHSMGGQLVYDALTAFLPDVHVDFWCATASQVGFFEELKLFLASNPQYSKGKPVPFPPNLGAWWNVWDYDDFISYTARDIIQNVDDGNFDSGMSLLAAHGGYLECPSFYRRFASKLSAFLKAS
jgi:hypothetical protein